MYKIYHNPRCTKSRETLSLLQNHTSEIEIIEYLTEVPSEKELKDILLKLNLKAEDIIRKGETIFKSDFKGKKLSEQEWIKAMIQYPKLIERPIVVKDNQAIIGRPPENVTKLF